MNARPFVWIVLALGAPLLNSRPLAGAPLRLVTGVGAGQASHVKAFDGSLATTASFFAYDPSFTGGVRVAAGDLDGDGWADVITGSGPGAAQVKAFSGQSGAELRSFSAFAGFTGGVHVASGDVTHDGAPDIVVGADAGAGPQVKVFDGAGGAEVRSFFAFGPAFSGGVRVASGDVNGDGFAEIVAGEGPGGNELAVFDGATGLQTRSFAPFPGFSGGIFVAAGDVNHDGFADLIAGADTGGGQVSVFDGVSGSSLFAFTPFGGFTGGVRVGAADLNGDGFADIVTGAGPGGAQVKVFSGKDLSELVSFLPYGPTVDGGVYVAGWSPVPEPSSLLLSALGAFAWPLMICIGRRTSRMLSHGCHG